MKRIVLLLLIIYIAATGAFAQSPMEQLIQSYRSNPGFITAEAKNASREKAYSISLKRLLATIEENTSETIDEAAVKSHIKELTLNENGMYNTFLYIEKADIGQAISNITTNNTQQTTTNDTQQTTTQHPSVVVPGKVPASVTFRFSSESYTPATKDQMESNVSKLLTAINNAYTAGSEINTAGIDMTNDCRTAIACGWKHRPYFITTESNITKCLRTSEGLCVRDIPVFSKNDEEHSRHISIAFTDRGQIDCVRFAAETASYDKIMKDGGREITDATDAQRRTSILSFVENYRMYYINMDIAKIEQIFADDAIIVTGSVITTAKKQKGDSNKVQMNKSVVYKRQNKEEYISALKSVFARNKAISVEFNDIRVCQDPDKPHIYGVTLTQAWDSESKKNTTYHDDGYVFLLWDFKNPKEPKIHVRTWQPVGGIEHKDQIFSLNTFKY